LAGLICSHSDRIPLWKEFAVELFERDSLGGSERLLDIEEQLKAEYQAVSRKPLKGALGRRER
jgi:hypothetical protein